MRLSDGCDSDVLSRAKVFVLVFSSLKYMFKSITSFSSVPPALAGNQETKNMSLFVFPCSFSRFCLWCASFTSSFRRSGL
jgi:hypothetical protein